MVNETEPFKASISESTVPEDPTKSSRSVYPGKGQVALSINVTDRPAVSKRRVSYKEKGRKINHRSM